MHLESEQVQRVLHDEVPAADAAHVASHLASCEACRGAVEQARADEAAILALLSALDGPRRLPNLGTVRRASRVQWIVPRRWAAGIVGVIALAGIAYAVPTSPLRRWIEARQRAPQAGRDTSAVAAALPAAVASDSGGVAVDPGRSLVVAFLAPQTTGVALVRLADAAELSVRSRAGTGRFAVGAGRLTIDNAGVDADFEIVVPRTAVRVEIQVAGVRVWLKDREQVVSDAPQRPDGTVQLRISR